MNSNLKQKLLSKQIKPRQFKIDDDVFYVRTVTVGDINFEINQRDKVMESIAVQKGFVIDSDISEEDRTAILNKIAEEYTTAMNIARYVCDETGAKLFNVESLNDLDAINSLPQTVLTKMERVTEVDQGPKT